MLHEYAIDPQCMGDWDTFRFLTSGIGISSGRLISRYPQKWLKKVKSVCLKNFSSFRQKQLLAEELARLKKVGLVDKNREYDTTIGWFSNALKQHQFRPFKAIIVDTDDSSEEYVLKAREITRNTPCWDIDIDMPVDRTINGLCCAVETLLEISDEIVFVDRVFDPAEDRWKQPLKRFVEIATNGRKDAPKIHFIFSIRDDELMVSQKQISFSEYCDYHLTNIFPRGVAINFYRIDAKPEGEGFHARYILTEKGGIRIDWGLDLGRPGQTTDVAILGNILWKKRWEDFYQNKADTFDLIDECKVVGKSV